MSRHLGEGSRHASSSHTHLGLLELLGDVEGARQVDHGRSMLHDRGCQSGPITAIVHLLDLHQARWFVRAFSGVTPALPSRRHRLPSHRFLPNGNSILKADLRLLLVHLMSDVGRCGEVWGGVGEERLVHLMSDRRAEMGI